MLCNLGYIVFVCVIFFCKQKTAYELRISDWSSDVCSSDLVNVNAVQIIDADNVEFAKTFDNIGEVLGRDRGAVQALERDALHLVALIGQFEADADAAEIIAQLTAKGCSGLGVELRVEAI